MLRELAANLLRRLAEKIDGPAREEGLGVPVDYDGPVLTPEARAMLASQTAQKPAPSPTAATPLRGSLEERAARATKPWPT